MPTVLATGTLPTLKNINAFCSIVYRATFTPEVAAEKLKKLPFVDALVLWRAGGCEAQKLVT